jgi:hypothetical protein
MFGIHLSVFPVAALEKWAKNCGCYVWIRCGEELEGSLPGGGRAVSPPSPPQCPEGHRDQLSLGCLSRGCRQLCAALDLSVTERSLL